MIERILILAAVAGLVLAGWGLVLLWQKFSVRRMQVSTPFAEIVPTGRPAVVSFSTPTCAECRTKQLPALKRLEASLGDRVVVRSLSALDYPDLVDQAGILTVPATIVLDAKGSVRHLNLGFTDTDTLALQLRSAT